MQLDFDHKRTSLLAATMFCILVIAELLKGHGLRAALIFSVIWSAISTSVYVVTRIYYFRKGVACPACNDHSK